MRPPEVQSCRYETVAEAHFVDWQGQSHARRIPFQEPTFDFETFRPSLGLGSENTHLAWVQLGQQVVATVNNTPNRTSATSLPYETEIRGCYRPIGPLMVTTRRHGKDSYAYRSAADLLEQGELPDFTRSWLNHMIKDQSPHLSRTGRGPRTLKWLSIRDRLARYPEEIAELFSQQPRLGPGGRHRREPFPQIPIPISDPVVRDARYLYEAILGYVNDKGAHRLARVDDLAKPKPKALDGHVQPDAEKNEVLGWAFFRRAVTITIDHTPCTETEDETPTQAELVGEGGFTRYGSMYLTTDRLDDTDFVFTSLRKLQAADCLPTFTKGWLNQFMAKGGAEKPAGQRSMYDDLAGIRNLHRNLENKAATI